MGTPLCHLAVESWSRDSVHNSKLSLYYRCPIYRTTSPKTETEQWENTNQMVSHMWTREEGNHKSWVYVTMEINIWSDNTLQTHFFWVEHDVRELVKAQGRSVSAYSQPEHSVYLDTKEIYKAQFSGRIHPSLFPITSCSVQKVRSIIFDCNSQACKFEGSLAGKPPL